MQLIPRDVPPRTAWALEQAGVSPLLARLYAARGVRGVDELDTDLKHLLPPAQLRGMDAASALLADAIATQQRLCIVADYDCDGATACAVAVRGLRALGAQHVDHCVPDRARDGYGLTPAIAQRVADRGAQVLITVDNGIASIDGVARARALGLRVLVTDHHLCAQVDGHTQLPDADAIVNPNQPGCGFASKALAGVGVMFYVLLGLRALLRSRGHFETRAQPRLDALLPLVALGTVADVVPLDSNNRRLVAQGLKRIRAGAMPAGMAALFRVAGRDPQQASAQDFGFALGPRLNAAGRLADMGLGIQCLLSDEHESAQALAQQLDTINRERRDIEGEMREQALAIAESALDFDAQPPPALCVFDPDFHEGVVGIVASRLKERWHRPSFVFAPSSQDEDELKGSGRSIAGFHLRDALDLLAKRCPGVLRKFGGHAMAAGCTIGADDIDAFEQGLQAIAAEWLDADALTRTLHTDGALDASCCNVQTAELLLQPVWGQGFAPPVFAQALDISSQRVVGSGHLQLKFALHGQTVDGIWFGRVAPVPSGAVLAYGLDINAFRGQRKLQFIVQGMAGE